MNGGGGRLRSGKDRNVGNRNTVRRIHGVKDRVGDVAGLAAKKG